MNVKARWLKRASALVAVLVLLSTLSTLFLPFSVYAAGNPEASGTVYYVSPGGNDANSGTAPGAAWKTLAKVSQSTFEPGDQILLDATGVWNERLVLNGETNGQGTAEKPIVVSKYNTTDSDQRPIINAGGTTMADTLPSNFGYRWAGAVELWNADHWHITSLEVTNQGAARDAQRMGIWVFADVVESYEGKNTDQRRAIFNRSPLREGVQVRDCYVHDVNGAYEGDIIQNPDGGTMGASKLSGGIVFLGRTNAYATDNHVKNVSCEGIRNAANSQGNWNGTDYGPNVKVVFRNNYIEEVSGDGMVLSCSFEGLAENNVVRAANNYNSGRNYAALWLMGTRNTLVQYNEVFDTRYAAGDGEAFDFDSFCNNSVYQYNYSHNNCGGVILLMPGSTNTVFRYNISVNDGRTGASRNHLFYNANSQNAGDTSVALIHNNTFVVGPTTGVLFDSSNNSNRIKFYNNIVMSVNGNTPAFNSGSFSTGAIAGNIVYPASILNAGSYTSGVDTTGNQFMNPQLARPGEEPSGVITPLSNRFDASKLDAYKVTANSPAIGAGIDVRGITPAGVQELFPLTTDLYGNPIDFDNITVGAHQYSNDAPANVLQEALPTSVAITGPAGGMPGTALGFTVEVGPEAAWNHDVVWSVSDPDLAAIIPSGKNIQLYLKAKGAVTLTAASAADPSVSAQHTVDIQSAAALESIALESGRNYVEEQNGSYDSLQLHISGIMDDGAVVPVPEDNISSITYTLNDEAQAFASVNPDTGVLSFTGDPGDATSLTVTATVSYTDYGYLNSFEDGSFGDMVVCNSTTPSAGEPGVRVTRDNAKTHDGSYSLIAQNASISNSNIRKTFSESQYGTVSMWFYDDLAAGTSKQGIAGNVVSNNANNFIGVYYESETSTNGSNSVYVYRINNASKWVSSEVTRTTGWHEFKWVFALGGGLTMMIDDVTIGQSTEPNGFNVISVATNWAGNNPGGNGRFYFDDIRFVRSAPVEFVSSPLTIHINPTAPVQIDVAAEGGSAVITQPGETLQMQHTTHPASLSAAAKAVSWAVENLTGSATIDENGLLTGKAPGTVRVTATSKVNGAVLGQLVVTVKDGPTLIEEITVASENGKLSIDTYKGTLQFRASYSPEEVDDDELVWTVTTINYDPTEWATIDQNGLLAATGVEVEADTPVAVRATNPATGVYDEVRVTLSNQTAGPAGVQLRFEGNLNNELDGSAVGFVGNPGYAKGVDGQAVKLDGNNYVKFADGADPLSYDSSFSFAFWYNRTSSKSDPVIFGNKNWSNGANNGFALITNGTKVKLNVKAVAGSRIGGTSDIPLGDIPVGEWVHMAAVFNMTADTVTVYVNGEAVSTNSTDFSKGIASGLPTYIGQGTSNNGLYQGTGKTPQLEMLMDNFVLTQRALTADEVKALATKPSDPEEPKDPIAPSTTSDLVLAVMSDPQMGYTQYGGTDAKFHQALAIYDGWQADNGRFDALLINGDLTENGFDSQFDTFNRILKNYRVAEAEQVYSMGNHDTWGGGYNGDEAITGIWKRFMDKTGMPGTQLTTDGGLTGEAPFFTKVVNGYTIIVLAGETTSNASWYGKAQLALLQAELQKAQQADAGKPIFVMVHQPTRNTVWGSDEWAAGNGDALYNVLKDYPQAIVITSHSHYAVSDEQSIHQRDFTTVGTGGVKALEYSKSGVDGAYPDGTKTGAEGLVIEVTKDGRVVIHRLNLVTGATAAPDWVIDLPIGKAGFTYTDDRDQADPYFEDDADIRVTDITETSANLYFEPAQDDVQVRQYEATLYRKGIGSEYTKVHSFLVYNQYYKQPIPALSYPVTAVASGQTAPTLLPGNDYYISLVAIDGSGNRSQPVRRDFTTLGDKPVVPESITIAASAEIAVDQKLNLEPVIGPADVSDDYKVFYVTSSNTAVARVDNFGRVYGVAPGTATITVAVDQLRSVTAQCEVTVTEKDPGQDVVTVPATGDTHVRPAGYANTVHGAETEVFVKETGSSYSRRALLQFDLTGVDLTGAERVALRVYSHKLEYGTWKGKPFKVNAFATGYTGWNEATATYNSLGAEFGMPALKEVDDSLLHEVYFDAQYADYLGCFEWVTPTSGSAIENYNTWLELDITDYLLANPGTESISICLIAQVNTQCLLRLRSKEYDDGSLAPALALYTKAQGVDTSELQAVVDALAELDNEEGTYTDESWAAFEAALASAKALLEKADATTAELDAEMELLMRACEGLTAARNVTAEMLQALCDEMEALDAALYTADSYNQLAAALAAAQQVLDESGNLRQRRDAYDALSTAFAALAPRATADGLEGLQAALDVCVFYHEADYTASSWQRFSAAMAAAGSILENPENVSADAVTAATEELFAAMGALARRDSDKVTLGSYIQSALEILEKPEDYTGAAIEKLRTALAAAQEVYANSEDQTEINAAAGALLDAIHALDEQGKRLVLNALVQAARLRQEADHLPNSWEGFPTALAFAETVLADEYNYGQQAVDEAVQRLRAALEKLVVRPSKDSLNAAIEHAQKILDNSTKYVAGTIEGLAAERDAAILVRDNANATRDEIADAAGRLAAANAKARLKADLSALKETLGIVSRLDAGRYTQASLRALMQVVDKAQAVTEETPQADVDNLNAELLAAYKALKEIPVEPTPVDPTPTNPTPTDPTPTTPEPQAPAQPRPTTPEPPRTPTPAQPNTPDNTGETGTTAPNAGEGTQPGTGTTVDQPGSTLPMEEPAAENQPNMQAPTAQPQQAEPNYVMYLVFGALGGIAFAAVVAFLLFVILKRRKKSQ